MSMVYFPALDIAARRLGLTFSERAEIVEATLSRMDRGCGVTEAVRMSLIDFLRRKGAYHGAVKTLVDTGLIYQLQEDSIETHFQRSRQTRAKAPAAIRPTARKSHSKTIKRIIPEWES